VNNYTLTIKLRDGRDIDGFTGLGYDQAIGMMHYWSDPRVRHDAWMGLSVIDPAKSGVIAWKAWA
jgi:hypothetical protein